MSLHAQILELKQQLNKIIVGQERLVDRLLIALLADGHLLVEGAPGLAKTKSIKVLSQFIEADFHRIQFTPDLLPADITGSDIYRPETGQFAFQSGPIFHNLILADEINRAAAKVQSALLEAMGEHQVSVGNTTYPLPKLFLVMATQNPLEHEGTFSLPEAQLDRFMMHVKISYPEKDVEKTILRLVREENINESSQSNINHKVILSQNDIFLARKEILKIHMDHSVEEYLIQLVFATRRPEKYNDNLAKLIQYGASPRATIYLDRACRAFAFLHNKDYVSPMDIKEVVHEILRHRIGLSFEAESLGYNQDKIIDEILSLVSLP